MMIDATVCEGTLVATELQRLLDNDDVAYIHLHNAKQGCFSCQVNRVETQTMPMQDHGVQDSRAQDSRAIDTV